MIQMGGYITTKMKIPPVLAISTYVILKGPPYSDRNGTRLSLIVSVKSRDVLKTCRKVVLTLSIFYENNKSRTSLRVTGTVHECRFFTHEWIFVLITQFGAVQISKVQP